MSVEFVKVISPLARPAKTQASKRNTPIPTVKGWYPLSKEVHHI